MKIGIARKEELDRALTAMLDGKARALAGGLCRDRQLALWQNQANHVSIVRLGYNDHGPVHMRIVALHALKILNLLREAGVRTSLESEELGDFDDSRVAVLLAAMLHDTGMGVTRDRHEWHSILLAMPLAERYLDELYPDDPVKRTAISCMVREAIAGHMGHDRIHSVEAGVLLVADGTDMTRGRARIAKLRSQKPMLGDMHRHSADAINEVALIRGEERPVHICVKMDDFSGIFQVEEVLMQKISFSPIRQHIELSVIVKNEPPRRYL